MNINYHTKPKIKIEKRLLLFYLLISGFQVLAQNNLEILDYKSSKINGIISNSLSRTSLIKLLGKPDKIENFDPECGLTDKQEKAKIKRIFYYGKTTFFVFDNNAELSSISFVSSRFTYNSSLINLSFKTTLKDLQKVFPKSVKNAIKENGGKLIRLKTCKNCDDEYHLYIEKGILVKLELWNDC